MTLSQSRWIALFMFLIPLIARPAHAGTVVVDESFAEMSLGKQFELAYDPSGSLTIQDVIAGTIAFSPSSKETPGFGYRPGAEWARVTLKPTRSTTLVWENGYAQTDRMDAWVLLDGRLVAHSASGDHVPMAEWDRVARQPLGVLRLEGAQRYELVLRLESEASHQLPVTLYTDAAWQTHRWADSGTQGAYFGAIFVMLAYNLLLAITTRSRAYASYSAFLFAMACMQCSLNGWAHMFFGSLGPVQDAVLPISIAGVALTVFDFAERLLGRADGRAMRASRFLGQFLAILPPILYFTVGYGPAIHVDVVSTLVALLWVMAFASRAALRGSTVARIYLAAWGTFFVGTSLYVLKTAGWVPAYPVLSYAPQIGSAFEFVLLSIALADRIKQLQSAATANAELAASNARAAEEASARALDEQERTNLELKRLDKVKDEFLANTSHELRTPLHGILGLTEGVLRSCAGLDGGSRERLEMVVASGRRLASLVNDILDFSKLRHQELSLREKSVDLHGAAAMTLAVLAPSAAPKGLALVNAVPLGLTVRADESRLQQILTNLVGNAVKFTPAGSVTVAARGAKEDGRIVVSVEDTGIGIAKDAKARVFESFEQADGSTAREFGGTGLGLAVTKKLVELHGGTIGLDSEVGRGSIFAFDLARADAREGASVEVPSPEVTSMKGSAPHEVHDDEALGSIGALPAATGGERGFGHARGARLLVADDDPVNVEVLKAQLEPEGHEVVVARDGAQAVAALERSGPFDGVLLDVMMPKMTGPQAAECMRAQYPHGTLPILMLTAKNRPEDAVTGLRAGADDYVGKPFHRDELLARLDVHLDAARTTRALERFVRPRLVELAGKPRPSDLVAGDGRGVSAILVRFALEGLGALAAKNDERSFFERVGRVVRALVEQVELHGGVVEAMSDDQLSAIFVGHAQPALVGVQRALCAARDIAVKPLDVAALVHAGAVNVGAVGADDWISVHALGEAAIVASAVGRWSGRAGFGLVVTDAFGAKLEEWPAHRYLGAARVGTSGHPVGLYEVGTPSASFDVALRSLERGHFAAAVAACRDASAVDPLARAIVVAAERGHRDIAEA